ncbi:hypothetical protein [Alloactinosynnema sp. L-07]|uniref:hypothetical protein n=1 Tax=Alloactinosynnema sp. L-07 TaxID=1653480 RepID=UPI0006B639C4|nr:hypothetical protein [Alloactinosynnema sp. L-07]
MFTPIPRSRARAANSAIGASLSTHTCSPAVDGISDATPAKSRPRTSTINECRRPYSRPAWYQGFFGSGFAVARMVGPLLLTTMILTWGPLGWLTLGALFLGAALAMGPAIRWVEHNRPTAAVLVAA